MMFCYRIYQRMPPSYSVCGRLGLYIIIIAPSAWIEIEMVIWYWSKNGYSRYE